MLEDIELRRQDATFLNALGAQRLPDPTTAGDFTRRFRPSDIETLMDCINRVRTRIWKKRARGELKGTKGPPFHRSGKWVDLTFWGHLAIIISGVLPVIWQLYT